MKLLADMLNKKAYNAEELKALRALVDKHVGKRLELRDAADSRAVQPEPGDVPDRPRPADRPERRRRRLHEPARMGLATRAASRCPWPTRWSRSSTPPSTTTGRKPPLPFATEADVQGLLTMLFFTCADRRQSAAVHGLPQGVGAVGDQGAGRRSSASRCRQGRCWAQKGLVDGDNSGSASLRLGGQARRQRRRDHGRASPCRWPTPATSPAGATPCTFVSPGGIEGIAGRLAYSSLSAACSA